MDTYTNTYTYAYTNTYAYTYTNTYTLHGPGTGGRVGGGRPGGRARARVRYMYLYMYMHTYLYVSPCSFLIATFGEESILGTCSWKNEHGSFGTKVKTNTFLKMAPQAKPLCSRDRYRNAEQNPGLHV